MWDVIWTDPDRQSIKERREQKDKEAKKQSRLGKRAGRFSVATTKSASSNESEFSKSSLSTTTNTNGGKSESKSVSASSGLSRTASPNFFSAFSPFSQIFEAGSRRSSGLVTTAPTSPVVDSTLSTGLIQKSAEILGDKTRSTCVENSYQTICLGEGDTTSQRIKNQEDVETDNAEKLLQLLQELSAGAQGCEPRSSCSGLVDQNVEIVDDDTAAGFENLIQKFQPPPEAPILGITERNLFPESPVLPVPPPKSPMRKLNATQRVHDPEAWKPIKKWKAVDSNRVQEIRRVCTTDTTTPCVEYLSCTNSLECSPLKMHVISPVGILSEMNCFWAKCKATNYPDHCWNEAIQLALLMLYQLCDSTRPSRYHTQGQLRLSNHNATEILVLDESEGTVSYLASLHPTKKLHQLPVHLADLKSSPVCSNTKAFKLAYGYSFHSKYSLYHLPYILNSVHSHLEPGGELHITIIDPLPCFHTVGNKMWEWMSKNLLEKLKERNRSLEPNILIARLLGEAGLRGFGSERTKIKCFALPESARLSQYDHNKIPTSWRAEIEVKAEIRSLASRALWMEAWAPLIDPPPKEWWWEDKAVVEECHLMGTFWEIHQIKAVKS